MFLIFSHINIKKQKYNQDIYFSWQAPINWKIKEYPQEKLDRLKQRLRKELGLKGRDWAVGNEAGFTAQHMGDRIIEGINELFNTWEPRESFEFINTNEVVTPTVPHKLLY